MTGEQEVKPEKVNNDRMAIIVAGIAIGISLIATPGLYTLMNIPIGLVLIVTLHAVDSRRDDSWFQSASFALAWALTSLVIVGVFLVNPYLTDDHGMFKTDEGYSITDPLYHSEIPAIEGIKHTLRDEAGDAVSVCFVSIVAIFWYFRRRRLYTIQPPPLLPQDEDKDTLSSTTSPQPVPPPTEKKQESPVPTSSASTSFASVPGQHTVDRVILSVFTAVMALLVYVINTRGSKHT